MYDPFAQPFDLIVTSPGRINIIGEHTDYNLGFVLPTAIDKHITFYLRKNATADQCHIWSKDTNNKVTIELSSLQRSSIMWENYIIGVLYEIQTKTAKLGGFDCIIESNLPVGAGLSSSAALECGLACGLNSLFCLGLTNEEIVKLSRTAEHTFVGTKCGIMDQYASVLSKSGHVLLLDCETVTSRYIPLHLGEYQILLLNTNVSHSLADSAYNQRLEECEQGVRAIQQVQPQVQSLRDVDISLLNSVKTTINSTVYNRCTYVIEENLRVHAAVEALETNNLKKLGNLLYQSHQGLNELYEVSCPELNFLVEATKEDEAILGSRMMGGGFGGCTINLVHKDAVDSTVKRMTAAYKKKFNIALKAYMAMPSGGTSIEKISK